MLIERRILDSLHISRPPLPDGELLQEIAVSQGTLLPLRRENVPRFPLSHPQEIALVLLEISNMKTSSIHHLSTPPSLPFYMCLPRTPAPMLPSPSTDPKWTPLVGTQCPATFRGWPYHTTCCSSCCFRARPSAQTHLQELHSIISSQQGRDGNASITQMSHSAEHNSPHNTKHQVALFVIWSDNSIRKEPLLQLRPPILPINNFPSKTSFLGSKDHSMAHKCLF